MDVKNHLCEPAKHAKSPRTSGTFHWHVALGIPTRGMESETAGIWLEIEGSEAWSWDSPLWEPQHKVLSIPSISTPSSKNLAQTWKALVCPCIGLLPCLIHRPWNNAGIHIRVSELLVTFTRIIGSKSARFLGWYLTKKSSLRGKVFLSPKATEW